MCLWPEVRAQLTHANYEDIDNSVDTHQGLYRDRDQDLEGEVDMYAKEPGRYFYVFISAHILCLSESDIIFLSSITGR